MLATPLGSADAPEKATIASSLTSSAITNGARSVGDSASGRPADTPTSGAARPLMAQVAAIKKPERRVTRSSLGDARTGNLEYSEVDHNRAQAHTYLPLITRIVLTTRQPSERTSRPSNSATTAGDTLTADPTSAPPPSDAVADAAPRQNSKGKEAEKPLFRLLDEGEILPPRGARHAIPAEADTSDAFYLRLHRYPEVLEKRASRLERERLIHERSKLIAELEELRGRTWVYAGTSAGGRAEEERQRRIREMEERLARYDALLPNQPRKSNFLNLSVGTGPAATPPSGGAPLSRRDSQTRTQSPAVPATWGARSRREPIPRPLTPMSASAASTGGRGGMRIRIKFGTPTTPVSPRRRDVRSSMAARSASADQYDDDDGLLSDEDEGAEDGDSSMYTFRGELRRGPKRDRKAERARAEERKRLGLPPRASIAKALTGKSGIERRPSRRRRTSKSYANGGDDDDDKEEEEEEHDSEADGDDWDGHHPETERPLRASTSKSHAPAPPVRKRLVDSFFHSAALRDAVMASHGPNARRASTRVAYAFGQRLPDVALLNVAEFEPRGGVTGDADDDEEGYSRTTLEAMVQQRSLERHGESTVLLDGRVLPKSALDVWRDGPMTVSPARRRELTSSSYASSKAASSAGQDNAGYSTAPASGPAEIPGGATTLSVDGMRSTAPPQTSARSDFVPPAGSNALPAVFQPPLALKDPRPARARSPPPRKSVSPHRTLPAPVPPLSLSMSM